MSGAILVLNSGSSSLKFSVFLDQDPPPLWLRGQIDGLPAHPRFVARNATAIVEEREWEAGSDLDHERALEFLFDWGRGGPMGEHRVVAVGHRVVLGGVKFTAPVRISPEVVAALERLVPLAPLHQPHHLTAIKAIARQRPDLPQVACFDTSFHRVQPAVAQAFALPRRYTEEGVHRYGYHGLSYEYVITALPGIDHRAAVGRTVIAHLGNGASMCAVRNGSSVATTMSLTALDGLMMGTRCGSIDPGVLLYMMRQYRMDAADLEQLLYEESGLLGVSGISGDMRKLLASTDRRAAEAIDLFIYRISRELGSLAAALGGIDALVFTGGIGEHAAFIRERISRDARWLGLDLDQERNARGGPRISRKGSRVTAWVIPTNEELMIALHTRRVLGAMPARDPRTEEQSDHGHS